ncbi:MAG: class II aldolase/adducin family protein [Janthinobacterium lividum]
MTASSVGALQASVVRYCAALGGDALLVQGAGGNVSWKEGDILWIKASGTWLEDAAEKHIFVPVDLAKLRGAIALGDFSVTPELVGAAELKPSIETLLHALMPHAVVTHLHAIEVLAHLVRSGSEEALRAALGDTLPWVAVDYQKPGADLAAAVSRALERMPDTKIVFLKKHGVVIGGADVEDVHNTLTTLIKAFATPLNPVPLPQEFASPMTEYTRIDDKALQRLAFDDRLFSRLDIDWVLYPDHVVFLGPKAHTYEDWDELRASVAEGAALPELVFVRHQGVFATATFTRAKKVQLRCYYDVLERQNRNTVLAPLSLDQIGALLNWDAEQYRMRIAKK